MCDWSNLLSNKTTTRNNTRELRRNWRSANRALSFRATSGCGSSSSVPRPQWAEGRMKAEQEAPPPSPGLEGSAIRCREVCRSYGKLKVLSNLNLTVKQGYIYGLLGPSGCGKTTLLKCILGTLKISRGHISVLGKPPAFPGHQVPGRMVGYMPQDLALYNEFSISDTLTFFGRIHGLTTMDTQARMDFLVGLMRNGRLLAEGEPETLMKQNSAATLEKAFLQLCETSDQVSSKHCTYPQGGVLESSQSLEGGPEESTSQACDAKVEEHRSSDYQDHGEDEEDARISLMCLCIGGDPKGIQVAVVNNETSSSSFSQSLLSFLDNSSVQQVNLSHAEAFAGAYNGEYWGVIGFGKNFTSYLTKRMIQRQVSKEVVDGGSAHVWLDLTNRQIALMLQKKIHDAFEFEEPIYGSLNSDFTTFVTPGAHHFLPGSGLDCSVLRVSSMETVLAYLISQLIIISVQIFLLLLLMLLVFKIPNEGNLVLVIALIVLQGVTGTSFGLVISSAIDDEQNATQAALGIFYPNLIVSGIIWPVECIPYPLRYISLALPQTYASEALRCIMYRGWGLSRMIVWRGFAVTLGWNTFFVILAIVILKLRM
ncbi:unnamed protein product [Coregonus sp. 'balchen']|nr:unnamed protein product [Coregonus sp. 'balchen']